MAHSPFTKNKIRYSLKPAVFFLLGFLLGCEDKSRPKTQERKGIDSLAAMLNAENPNYIPKVEKQKSISAQYELSSSHYYPYISDLHIEIWFKTISSTRTAQFMYIYNTQAEYLLPLYDPELYWLLSTNELSQQKKDSLRNQFSLEKHINQALQTIQPHYAEKEYFLRTIMQLCGYSQVHIWDILGIEIWVTQHKEKLNYVCSQDGLSKLESNFQILKEKAERPEYIIFGNNLTYHIVEINSKQEKIKIQTLNYECNMGIRW